MKRVDGSVYIAGNRRGIKKGGEDRSRYDLAGRALEALVALKVAGFL